MPKNKIYLDSCIFVAHFDENDSDHKHDRVIEFLSKISENENFVLVSHSWALSEMTKALTLKDFSEPDILRYSGLLLRRKRIESNKIEWLPESTKKNFDFDDFFYDLQEYLLEFRKHLADTIHITVMINNDIEYLATFDTGGFNNIRNLTAINPDDIDDYL